ncbi:reverse transcriptase domain-containing protein [Tanacetum coccineum]
MLPIWMLTFEIMCDASDYAIGAVLGQRIEKHFRPIHYASKTMTEAESNYTTTEKEMLAVVYAFEKFRSYLIMNKSVVYTDHSALKYLFNKKDAKAKIACCDSPNDTPTIPTITSTPTPTVFGDDETIAQVLVTMSQNKLKQKEKEKGVELKDVEDIERPRPTSTRSLLTLKPLPKIDLKAKGKGKIEEEDESNTESEDITEAEKKFKMLANDEEMARKVQEEWEAEEEKKRLAEEEATKTAFTNEYDFIQARLNADKILAEKLQEEEREKFTIEERAKSDENFIAIGSFEDERLIKDLNKKATGIKKDDSIKEESKEEEGPKRGNLAQGKTPDEDKELDYKILDKNNGHRRYFSTLMRVLSIFDRDDLNVVYKLVMDRYQDEIPKGVHTLMTEAGLVIHMLVEKKYPLRKKVLMQMLELKLESEEDSTMALELIRFVKKLVAKLEPEDSDGDEEDL